MTQANDQADAEQCARFYQKKMNEAKTMMNGYNSLVDKIDQHGDDPLRAAAARVRGQMDAEQGKGHSAVSQV